jgi:hypothetical protein
MLEGCAKELRPGEAEDQENSSGGKACLMKGKIAPR